MVTPWEAYLGISDWNSKHPPVNNFLNYLRYKKIGSEGSRSVYCNVLFAFCKYANKSPDELVALPKADVEKLIESFCYWKMKNKWKSPRTANTAQFILKTFFKTNGFKGSQELDVECFHQSVRDRTRPEYIPTSEESRGMANVAGSLRNRAIIFFLGSTGLRNGTLRALLYGDLKDELEKGQQNILIKVHKGMKKTVSSACKGNIEYNVFTSAEATEAMKLYVDQRRRIFGEIQDAEILFCSEHNQLGLKERANKPLSARELEVIVKTAARKAGIKEWKNVVPHSLRKTFESVLRSQFADGGRLDLKTQEYFMGHLLGGSRDTYYDKTKFDELRKEYAKLIFKPEKQASIEVLDSLRGMARVLGVDLARLEESRAKELGRDLDDTEKLIITQGAIKKVVNEFKKAVELNARTTLFAGSCKEPKGEQCLTEKNQTSSFGNEITFDDSVSSQNSPSRLGSFAVCPSTKQAFGSQTIPCLSSIQFNLEMRPQESFARLRQERKTRRESSAASDTFHKEKGNGVNLSQFL